MPGQASFLKGADLQFPADVENPMRVESLRFLGRTSVEPSKRGFMVSTQKFWLPSKSKRRFMGLHPK